MYPGRWITVVSRMLAVLIAAAEPSYWVGHALGGVYSVQHDLPLELSRVAEFVSAAALWWPKPFLVELTYFWGLGAIVQALATPDITEHFHDPAYFRFFVGHGGVLVAAVFLVVGRRIWPRPGGSGSGLRGDPGTDRRCGRRRCRDEWKLYVPAREASRR